MQRVSWPAVPDRTRRSDAGRCRASVVRAGRPSTIRAQRCSPRVHSAALAGWPNERAHQVGTRTTPIFVATVAESARKCTLRPCVLAGDSLNGPLTQRLRQLSFRRQYLSGFACRDTNITTATLLRLSEKAQRVLWTRGVQSTMHSEDTGPNLRPIATFTIVSRTVVMSI